MTPTSKNSSVDRLDHGHATEHHRNCAEHDRLFRQSQCRPTFMQRLGQPFGIVLMLIATASSAFGDHQTPDIVLILTDAAGHEHARTHSLPNLDRLAQQGVEFTDTYAGPAGGPWRAALATGFLHSRIGFDFDVPTSEYIIATAPVAGLKPEQLTLFDVLKSAGYQTGMIGHWGLGHHSDNVQNGIVFREGNSPTRQGVDEFRGVLAGCQPPGNRQPIGTAALRHQWIDQNGVVQDQIVEDETTDRPENDILGDWSVDFIKRHRRKNRPFFLCTSFTTQPDASANETQTSIASSLQDMQSMDDQLGRIAKALKASGPKDHSIVIFVSNSNAYLASDRRAKSASNHERSLMVVSEIAGNASVSRDSFHHPVHVCDLFPTIANLAGAQLDPEVHYDGVDLSPHLGVKIDSLSPPASPPHPHLYLRDVAAEQVALRMDQWKLQHQSGSDFVLLDLATNPNEDPSLDLASHHPRRVEEMKQILARYDAEMMRPLWNIDNFCTEFRLREGFRFPKGINSTTKWSDKKTWSDERFGSGNRTLSAIDSFANTGLVFRAHSSRDYQSQNDLTRISGLPFMANYIRIRSREGRVSQDVTATIGGKPVLLTNSLDGQSARIQLLSSSPKENLVTFDFTLPIELAADLLIAGGGSDIYRFTGGFHEQQSGTNLIKKGKSTFTIAGESELSGTINLLEGTLRIEHPSAIGNAAVNVMPGGRFISTVSLDPQTRIRITGDGLIEIPDE